MVVERGIAVSYKYNPLASVPVPEICVPVLCSRAQKVAVIVIKRKCRLIPDLPAPVAQLFVPGGSVDIMTNGLGYQTSNELKNSNVLYLKVIHKPFQPKLEVTAVSTIMTLTSDNFSFDFSSYISKKRSIEKYLIHAVE